MSEWQPIETAPKDGTRIIGLFGDGDVALVDFYQDEPQGWYISFDHVRCETPTHWMPLPAPPKVDA